MGRRFRRSMKQPGEKNYVITNAAGVPSGTVSSVIVADADDGILDDSVGVPGTVRAIFVSASIGVGTLVAGATMAIWLGKDIGGGQFPTMDPNTVLANVTQQQTIYWLRMQAHPTTNPMKFVGWLKIPRRHQIFNEGDRLRWNMNVTNAGQDYDHCTNFVYKHYR